jgi:hypothetical protein
MSKLKPLVVCVFIFSFIIFPTNAQSGIVGVYGYTYYIAPPLALVSTYNVFGEVMYVPGGTYGGPYGRSRFQTYAVHQGGPVIYSFEKLALSGRVWRQPETIDGCPPILYREGTKHWLNASGARDVNFLYLDNPDYFYNRIAVGRHRLVHPDAKNVQWNTPRAFYVKVGDAYGLPASTVNHYNGVSILGCY